MSGWYQNYDQFVSEGGNLLSIIFPDMPKEFENKLNELIQTSYQRNVEIVLATLMKYKGQSFLDNLCKGLIKNLSPLSHLLDEIKAKLLDSGVVNGEYGLLEAYKQKQARISGWLNDENERIRLFAASFYETLNNLIETEQARPQEEIEIRKHLYGDSENT